jgi:hypothetical protein
MMMVLSNRSNSTKICLEVRRLPPGKSFPFAGDQDSSLDPGRQLRPRPCHARTPFKKMAKSRKLD